MSDTTTSSLEALGREYELITHNLANANTTGFKRQVSAFELVQEPGQTPTGDTSNVTGSVASQPFVDFSQGRLLQTGRSLDVALAGKGFLVLETEQGERYTRNGAFRTNGEGQLVDSEGRTVAGEGGPVIIPNTVSPAKVAIQPDGRILAEGKAIGKLRVVEFEDPTRMTSVGAGAFAAPADLPPAPAVKTTVYQGFQEASNVSPVRELVALIHVSRLYEANARIIQMERDLGKQLMTVAMA